MAFALDAKQLLTSTGGGARLTVSEPECFAQEQDELGAATGGSDLTLPDVYEWYPTTWRTEGV